MRIIKPLLSVSLLTGVLFSSVSPAVLAYNPWEMQRDQQTVNQLAAEGVIAPNSAMYLDNKAANKAYGSWWHNGVSPMVTPGAMLNASMPAAYPLGQVRKEDRQISQLERDGVLSHRQGNVLKSEVNSQANMMMAGASPFARPFNTGYYAPTQMVSAQMVPTQMLPTSFPTATPVNYVPGYYNNQNMPFWTRVRNSF
jgi:hypothetical protein